MKAIVLSVGKLKQSKHGGQYVEAVFLSLDNNQKYRFHCYLNHSKSERFYNVLKPQAIFENLSVVKVGEKEYIDGCSDFIYKGIKTKQDANS